MIKIKLFLYLFLVVIIGFTQNLEEIIVTKDLNTGWNLIGFLWK